MRITRTFCAEDRDEWRHWLETHGSSAPEIWLILYKKRLRRGVSLDEAVEEGLCFGWIDSQLCLNSSSLTWRELSPGATNSQSSNPRSLQAELNILPLPSPHSRR